MKHSLFFLLRVIVLAILGAVAVPASAQTTAQGFYYPPPAWDLQLQCNTPASCPRFIVLSDWSSQAVLDRETGLVWELSPSTVTLNSTWEGAQIHCNQLNLGKRLGWRLPTVQELASLVDPTQSNPALPAGHPFPNGERFLANYWSATTDATDATFGSKAWFVSFLHNGVVNTNVKANGGLAWCVRGGQGVDPQ